MRFFKATEGADNTGNICQLLRRLTRLFTGRWKNLWNALYFWLTFIFSLKKIVCCPESPHFLQLPFYFKRLRHLKVESQESNIDFILQVVVVFCLPDEDGLPFEPGSFPGRFSLTQLLHAHIYMNIFIYRFF